MAGRMIWFDSRLKGRTPNNAPNVYTVDANTDIEHAIGWIGTYARSQGGLDELMVMCHGIETNWDYGHQMSTSTVSGGFGLELCKQGLSLMNSGLLRAWREPTVAVRQMTIYACAAADVAPGNAGTYADGPRFMGEMALYSGAAVVASTMAQTYNPESIRKYWPKPIDFGGWEGPVFRFDPETGAQVPTTPGPMH